MEDPWKSVEFSRNHYAWFLTIPSSDLRANLVTHGLISLVDSMDLRCVKIGREHNATVLELLVPKGKKSFAKLVDVLEEMGYEDRCEKLRKLVPPDFDRPSSHSGKTADALPIPKAVSVDEPLNGRPSTCRDSSDEMALLEACESGKKDEVEKLIQRGVNVNCTEDTQICRTPLHIAAQKNYDTVARVLLNHGADTRATDKDGYTALHFTANSNSETVIACLLLDAGSDPSAKSKLGITPLHYAAQNNYDKVARVLLKYGADARAKDKDGTTPLHVAVKCNSDSVTVARLLLDADSDPSAQNKLGITPLYTAAQNNNDVVAGVLLKYGADTSTADTDGKTPLDVAESGSLVANLLQQKK